MFPDPAFTWRTSSYSNANGDCVEVGHTGWRTSSHSNGNGDCVEVGAGSGGAVGVRDSKDRGGPVLALDGRSWTRFLDAVRRV